MRAARPVPTHFLGRFRQRPGRAIRSASRMMGTFCGRMWSTLRVEVLLYVRLPRAEVLQRWAPLDVAEPIPTGTKGKETACKGWLTALMRAEPDRPRPKEEVWAEASHKFPGLAQRAFERAWRDAAKDSGADAWRRPGRRREIQSPH
jgi:hypothetical protein